MALLAACPGAFGLAGMAAAIAKVLLVVFVILLTVSGVANAVRDRPLA